MQVCREPQSTDHQNDASEIRMKTQQSQVAQLQQFNFYAPIWRNKGILQNSVMLELATVPQLNSKTCIPSVGAASDRSDTEEKRGDTLGGVSAVV